MAEVLESLRFDQNVGTNEVIRSTKLHLLSKKESIREYRFVRHYYNFPKSIVSLDNVEKIFGCIRLIRDREGGLHGEISAARTFSVVPVCSIGAQNVDILINEAMEPMNEVLERRKEPQNL